MYYCHLCFTSSSGAHHTAIPVSPTWDLRTGQASPGFLFPDLSGTSSVTHKRRRQAQTQQRNWGKGHRSPAGHSDRRLDAFINLLCRSKGTIYGIRQTSLSRFLRRAGDPGGCGSRLIRSRADTHSAATRLAWSGRQPGRLGDEGSRLPTHFWASPGMGRSSAERPQSLCTQPCLPARSTVGPGAGPGAGLRA